MTRNIPEAASVDKKNESTIVNNNTDISHANSKIVPPSVTKRALKKLV
jgi:hypothetical protein